MNVAEMMRLIALEIRPVAQEENLLQARILLGDVLGLMPGALTLHGHMELSTEQLGQVSAYVARRKAGEPLQYILGQWSFMGLPVLTEPCALIPRQDTETMVEQALALAREKGYQSALDLCCGSGCIAVALAALGGLDTAASDCSDECLELTKRNAEMNGVSLQTYCGDLFMPLCGQRFDLIVCNPPYLTRADMAALQSELRFEPETALYGGADGLDFYRRIARQWRTYCTEGGSLLLEVGIGQAQAVRMLFERTRTVFDLNGIERVIICENPC